MIRVLHICAELDGGGVERSIYNYYNNMNRDEFDFDFVVHSEKKGILEDSLTKLGCDIYHVVSKRKNFLLYRKQLGKIFEANDYDVVHCHQGYMSFIPLNFAKSYKVTATIAHAHTIEKKESLARKAKRKFSTILTKQAADYLFSCSEAAGNWMWGNSQFRIIKNAVDISQFIFDRDTRNEMRSQLNIEDDAVVIGAVGRLAQSKNYKFLLEIFCEIKKNISGSILVVVGTGSEEENIKNIIEKNQIKNVLLLGARNDVGKLLNTFDAFVLPTLYEGLGMAYIEAQLNGLPCFAPIESVTNEVEISTKMHWLSLLDSAKVWADAIIDEISNNDGIAKEDVYLLEEVNSYNIKLAAKDLEYKYLNFGGNRE